MRNTIFFCLALMLLPGILPAQTKPTPSVLSLNPQEIASGLKLALEQGVVTSTRQLSTVDGFFKDAAVKLAMPPEAKKLEQRLRSVGLGKLADDAILSMNRAAEDASALAAPIFMDAIKKMTIQDGMKILQGSSDAATQYLKQQTGPALTKAFQPVVKQSLDKVKATQYWADACKAYNKVSLTKMNPDLEAYVTAKTLDGLFYQIAQEEKKIRANPAASVQSLTQKVFGALKRP